MTVAVPVPSPGRGASATVGRSFSLPRIRIHALVFATIMLLTGGAGILIQNVLSVVYTYLLGGSIEQFTTTLAVMLLGMGVGVILEKRITLLGEAFVAAELLLAFLGASATVGTQWLFVVTGDDFVWVKFVQMMIMGMLIGIEIPLVMRINERYTRSLGQNMAETWAYDYFGGFLLSLGWLWALHQSVPVTQIGTAVGACNLAVAVIALCFFWQHGLLKRRVYGLLLAVGSILMGIALVIGANNSGAWAAMLTQKMYEDPVVFQTTTKYQNIVVTESEHPTLPAGKKHELFLNGNKQFSSVDERRYHEPLVHPAMNAAAKRDHVLVLGGGDGMAVREILKYPDVQDITLVDLDPGMIRLAQDNPILRELNEDAFRNARVHASASPGVTDTGQHREVLVETGEDRVACQPNEVGSVDCVSEPVTESVATVDVFTVDADKFIGKQGNLFDVVVIDLPDPNSVELAKLYSLEFYQKVKQAMSPDGIVVVQAASPYHAKEAYLCIMRTMAAAGLGVVPYHVNVPSFGDWGWVIGSPSLLAKGLYDRLTNIEFPNHLRDKLHELDENVLRASLVFNKGDLETQDTAISRVMDPVIYQYYEYYGWKVE